MKKLLLLTLALALLCGCASNPSARTSATGTSSVAGTSSAADTLSAASASAAGGSPYDPAADWPYGVNAGSYVRGVAPTEDGYYMVLAQTLFYMDRDAMKPVPVCSRPDCLHYSEPEFENYEACGAYLRTGQQSFLTYYSGKLYFFDQVSAVGGTTEQLALIRMEPDGSTREILYRFDEGTFVTRAVMHRGVLYAATQDFDQSAGSVTKLWAYSLTDTRKPPECLLTDEGGDELGGLQALTAYGDRLYFYRYLPGDGGREFCCYDTKTGKTDTVGVLDGEYAPLGATFIGNTVLLRCKSVVPHGDADALSSYPERLYRCAPDGSGAELVLEGFGDYSADDRYFYRVPSLGTFDGENRALRIYDAEGNEQDSVDLYGLMPADSIRAAGIMVPAGEQAILWLRGGEGEQRVYLYWFDKSEIGTGAIAMHPLLNYAYTIGADMRGTDIVDLDTDKMVETAAAAASTTMASVPTATTAVTTTAPVTTAASAVPAGPFINAAGWNTGSIEVEALGIDLEGASLRFLCCMGDTDSGKASRAKVWETVGSYIGQTYHGTVELGFLSWGEYAEARSALIAAGDEPDVFGFSSNEASAIRELAEGGKLLMLDDYIPVCMPRTYAKMPEAFYEGVRVGGQLYCMLNRESGTNYRTLLYDKALTDAAGVTPGDWTRISDNDEAFYRMREWLDENDPSRHDSAVVCLEVFVGWQEEGNFEMLGYPCLGIQYPGFETVAGKAASTEIFNIFDTAEFLDYLNRLHRLVEDRILPYDSNYALAQEKGYAVSGDPVFQVVRNRLASRPVLDGAGNWEACVQAVSLIGAAPYTVSLAVSAQTPSPASACKLIEILNNDPYVGTTLRLGEEGVHWVRTADGRADLYGGTSPDSGVPVWSGGFIGDITNCVIPDSEPAALRELLQGRMDAAVSTGITGFAVDSTGLEAEIAAVDAVYEAYMQYLLRLGSKTYVYPGKLCDGTLAPGETDVMLAEFIEELNAAGAEKLRREYQRQLDEWLAGR
ncbi:MAG: DUF3502 domain-containing protein [Eubacteriales bacterium]|nr:DUF3502 domain-containing protein [Eubacteriales bacterium]